MNPRGGRTRVDECDHNDAATRLAHAQKFLEVAELAASEDGVAGATSVATSCAVLAGIAASDAACCAALGERSRGQDHRDAIAVLERVHGGADASNALRRLLDLKDTANYGLIDVSGQHLKAALRQAGFIVEFARAVLRR